MQNKNGCSLVGVHKAKSDRCIAAGCLDRCPDIVASLSVASENFRPQDVQKYQKNRN